MEKLLFQRHAPVEDGLGWRHFHVTARAMAGQQNNGSSLFHMGTVVLARTRQDGWQTRNDRILGGLRRGAGAAQRGSAESLRGDAERSRPAVTYAPQPTFKASGWTPT